MRTLFIVPSAGQGGAEVQLINLANQLDPDKFSKHLIYFEQQNEILDKLDRQHTLAFHFPRQRKFDQALIRRLAAFIDEHGIDVVHATLLIGSFYAERAIRKATRKCRLVVALHSTKSRSLKEEIITRTLHSRSLRKAHRIIFVSDIQKEYWLARYPWMKARSVTVHNGISPDDFVRKDFEHAGRQLLKAHNINATTPIISCIAAFRTEKNHHLLINAVSASEASFSLCLAGSGPCLAAVKKQVEALGLQNKVHFLGRLDDVRPLLAVSALTVLASKSEAFSMAMLESLAMQVPMLSTDVGGMKEAIISGKSGYLVAPNNVAELTRGIEKLLKEPDQLKVMGLYGEQLVKRQFTQNNMLTLTSEILLEAHTTMGFPVVNFANRKPRLLLISPLPPPAGGIATWTKYILESELVRRYHVSLVDVNPGPRSGIDLRKLITVTRHSMRVVFTIVRLRPDIVHINTSAIFPKFRMECGYMWIAKMVRARVVMHLHGQGLDRRGTSGTKREQAIKWLTHADRVLVLSQAALHSLHDVGLTQARQVSNFVLSREPVSKETTASKNGIELLFVGWIMKEKGIFELLEAVARVPNVQLTLLGRFVDIDSPSGTNKQRVEDVLARLGIQGRVTLPGEVELAEVWNYYCRSDVFVLPSHSEGLPNVLLEAMMAGLPSIVTPVGAIPEVVVENETALVVPVEDIDALARAITTLSESKVLRTQMGLSARQRALSNYTREIVVTTICTIYDEILGIDTSAQVLSD